MFKLNTRHRLIIPVFMILSSILFLYARSTGITGRTLLGSTQGCTCHAAEPNGSVSVVINGPDTMEINSSATFEVVISGGPLVAAGTNIATDNGTLDIVDSNLKKENGELTHTSPLAPSAGSVTFTFQYTAPETMGEATIAATGNSVNLNGANTGDGWNFAENKGIEIVLPSALPLSREKMPSEISLGQNYPNPFNPSTIIDFSLNVNAFVSLDVYDMAGRNIAQLVNEEKSAGEYSVRFDGTDLTSGIYFYRITANNQTLSKQMLLVK